tara:strand:+ start:1403 stop:2371 length:969 start_codon:yes stop_codon:yes gene_type:complete
MKSLFTNQGPFDINFIIKNTSFCKKEKFQKKKVKNISNLIDSQKGDLTFFEHIKYINDLKNTKASFCLIREKYISHLKNACIPIISQEPLLDFILVSKLFYPDADNDNYKFKQNKKYKSLTKKNVYIDETVNIGKHFSIGFNSVLKKNIKIGNNVIIGSNCSISNAIIGDNVIINDGTVIGKIGYGFKLIKKKLTFIPHLGCVKIDDNVYIGSNCTIDRGSVSNTSIGESTMIDNLVHIAHNVKIGSFCFIAGQVGIAGSSVIGDNCMIGGQAGVSGHLKIGRNVNIGGHSGILNDLKDGSKVIGFPSMTVKNFLKRRRNDQ